MGSGIYLTYIARKRAASTGTDGGKTQRSKKRKFAHLYDTESNSTLIGHHNDDSEGLQQVAAGMSTQVAKLANMQKERAAQSQKSSKKVQGKALSYYSISYN